MNIIQPQTLVRVRSYVGAKDTAVKILAKIPALMQLALQWVRWTVWPVKKMPGDDAKCYEDNKMS